MTASAPPAGTNQRTCQGGHHMSGAIGPAAFAMTLGISALFGTAAVAADAKHPDLEGAWDHMFHPRWSAGEPGTLPPLTPEYMKIYEANLATMAAGGLGDVPSSSCVPYGMPMMMNAYDPLDIVVTPKITYILT